MRLLAGVNHVRRSMSDGRRRWMSAAAAFVAVAGCLVALFMQIEVTHDTAAVTRACGSAFDSVVDRSGWETWWARDLDEADDSVRSALVRTDLCPAAVNRRIAAAVAFGSVAAVLAILRRPPVRAAERTLHTAPSITARLERLGIATAWLGGTLTVAGAAGVLVLVADADSTLFLYTDRFVVGIVGLIVLMPTIALFVIGRVLTMVGTHIGDIEAERPDA